MDLWGFNNDEKKGEGKVAESGCPVLPSQRLMFQALESARFKLLSLSMLLFTGYY